MLYVMCWLGLVAPTAPDTVLFAEDFDQTIPLAGALNAGDGDWVSLGAMGDSLGSPGWEQSFDGMSYQGRGHMVVTPFSNADRCITKRKVLYTPVIDLRGNTAIKVSYWVKDQAGDQTQPQFSLVTAAGEPLTGSIGVQQVKTQVDVWIKIDVTLTGLGDDAYRGSFSYSSSPQQCNLMLLDELVVTSSCPRPDTVILEPADIGGPITATLGEAVSLRAGSRDGNNEGLTFNWQIRENPDAEPSFTTVGETVSLVFDQPGEFIVLCAAVNSCGEVDPIPAFRRFVVAQDTNLDTVITEPAEPLIRITRGQEITFQAQAVATKMDGIEFIWIVERDQADRGRKEYRGAMVKIRFEEAGRYLVLCSAKDGAFLDPVPAARVVEVAPVQMRIVEPKPERRRREIYAQVDVPVHFEGTLDDPTGLVANYGWVLQPGEELLCAGSLNCAITFAEPGIYAVAFAAQGSDGQGFGDLIYVVIDVPLYTGINEPDDGEELAVGQPFTLTADVLGTLTSDNDTAAAWILGGQEFPVSPNQTRLETMAPNEPGTYQVRFIAFNQRLGKAHESRHNIRVYDPGIQANPEIIRPVANQTVPPGGNLFFDSSYRNTRRDNRGALWQVCDAEGTVLGSASGATLGRIPFPDEGSYEIKLFLRGPGGDRLVDSRTITVGRPSLEPTGSAIAIDYGSYENLTLAEENIFSIQVPADGQTVTFNIDVDGEATFFLVNAATPENVLINRQISGMATFSVGKLPSGTYHWTLKPAAGKIGLGYSFGIEVLNPALYFTDIVEDGNNTTTIGVVNTTGEAADVELIAYDKDGSILAKLARTIAGQGSLKDRVADLFSEVSGDISWIRVDATRDLVGFSQVTDLSGTKSYAISGATYLEPQLSVPHIAKDTANWYTRANVTNGMPETIEATLETGTTSAVLANGASYAKDAFDFLEKFDQGIPEETNFGTFVEKDRRASLAGNEVFGLHATDQVVGLGLAGAPRDNPNFDTLTNNIYVTHIANVAQFWTAIALVNLGDYPQSVEVIAYGAGGNVLDNAFYQLQANEKQALLAADFYALVGIDGTGAEWLEIRADGNVTGYELFGTFDNKLMAGLEAITEVKQKICMPFIDGTGAFDHGIAVVNVSGQSSTVTFRIYDESGGLAASVTLPDKLAPKQKRIFVLEQLFEGLPLSGTWLEVDAEEGIVGFELFIGNESEHMSGLIAQ